MKVFVDRETSGTARRPRTAGDRAPSKQVQYGRYFILLWRSVSGPGGPGRALQA